MSQKRKKDLIIIGLIWIIVSIAILIMLCPEAGEMIQAEAIITLVFVTIFYAKQTQKLVEQEEKSLKEEIKKRNADFEEKKLKEFYNPFKYLLFILRTIVENEASPLKPILELHAKIARLGSSHGQMVTKELEDKAVELLNYLYKIKDINEEDEKQLEIWREEALKKIEDVTEQRQKEIDVSKGIINETYELFSERLDNISTREEGVNDGSL